MAIDAGADAIGLVSSMPSGPGVISEDLIRAIADTVPPPIATFLLTCHQRVDEIVAQQKRCGTNAVQLCDRLTAGSYAELRAAMPGVAVVQAIHVNGRESVEEAVKIAPRVDALLLDSGNQSLSTKELGGTGRTHDWRLSAEIRQRAEAPVFLAGGLRAENVRDAIRQVEPWGVDLCSGVRTDGRLDHSKLEAFMLAVRP
jgi:phosphoribosylanthranilate isomerase